MKLPLQIVFFAFSFFWAVSLFAGPFVKIHDIDTSSEFPKINVNVSVQDTGRRFVSGLDENDFSVYEDGYRVNYLKVAALHDQDEKVHVVLCIDSSKSIEKSSLTDLKSAALEILNGSSVNKTALYGFNDTVELMSGFNADRSSIVSSINGIQRSGSRTLLYNAIYDAIQLLEDADASKGAVIVFTDGMDDGSSVTVKDVINFAKDTGTPIFFVTVGRSAGLSSADRIAKLSGGMLINCSRKSDISKMYGLILSSAKGRYMIKYHSLLRPDNEKHKLEVRLSSGNIRDRDTGEFSFSRDFVWRSFFIRDNLLLYGILSLLLLALIIILILAVKQKRSNTKNISAGNNGSDREYASLVIPGIAPTASEGEDAVLDKNLSRYSNAWLIQKDGSETGKKFVLFRNETVIGRQPNCGLIIYDNSVSQEHAKIKNINGVFYIFDLISDNGTFLNGKKLLRPKPLYDWDELSIGRARFIFRGSKTIG